jgi:hypothetical protein
MMTGEHFEELSVSKQYLRATWLILYGDSVAIHSENNKKYMNTVCWQKCSVLML